jgi:outer membrane protein assembly factor BamD (BamD/ComL family)
VSYRHAFAQGSARGLVIPAFLLAVLILENAAWAAKGEDAGSFQATLQAEVDQAEDVYRSGDVPKACAAFLAIVDDAAAGDPKARVAASTSEKGRQAYERFLGIVQGAKNADLHRIAVALPKPNELSTAEAQFTLGKFYACWLEQCRIENATNDIPGIAHAGIEASFHFLAAYPNHELTRDAIAPLLEWSEQLSREEGKAAADRLKKYLEDAPSSFATYNAWYRLAERALERRYLDKAHECCEHMLKDYEQGVLNEALSSPDTRSQMKVRVEYSLGVALETAGREDEALAQYDRVQKVYASLDKAGDGLVGWAAFGSARIRARRHSLDPAAAVADYQSFIEHWPNSPGVTQALSAMAELQERAAGIDGTQ